MMNLNNEGWTFKEVKSTCKKEKPHLNDKELEKWAREVYTELNAINRSMNYKNKVYKSKNIPFSEHFAGDFYSEYGE